MKSQRRIILLSCFGYNINGTFFFFFFLEINNGKENRRRRSHSSACGVHYMLTPPRTAHSNIYKNQQETLELSVHYVLTVDENSSMFCTVGDARNA